MKQTHWQRPETEVGALMKLLVSSLRKEVSDLMKNNVRFTVIGDMKKFDQKIQDYLLLLNLLNFLRLCLFVCRFLLIIDLM